MFQEMMKNNNSCSEDHCKQWKVPSRSSQVLNQVQDSQNFREEVNQAI